MNGRISILCYWLQGKGHFASFMQLARLLLKPSNAAIAWKFTRQIREVDDFLEVTLKEIDGERFGAENRVPLVLLGIRERMRGKQYRQMLQLHPHYFFLAITAEGLGAGI